MDIAIRLYAGRPVVVVTSGCEIAGPAQEATIDFDPVETIHDYLGGVYFVRPRSASLSIVTQHHARPITHDEE